MNRMLVALGVILVLALGVWLYTSSGAGVAPSLNTATTPSPSTGGKTSPTTPAGVGSGNTYKSLLTQNGSYKCDYAQVKSAGGQGTSVIYIYGGKLRGEFRSPSGDVKAGSLVVYDGHYLYSWTEGKSTGTKTVLTSLSQLPSVIPQDLTSGSIYGTTYNSVGWNCNYWLTDPKILVPPSYVKFTDA